MQNRLLNYRIGYIRHANKGRALEYLLINHAVAIKRGSTSFTGELLSHYRETSN
jgi:hypothetical protein